jgi:peptidoglycan-associated lipoprotein
VVLLFNDSIERDRRPKVHSGMKKPNAQRSPGAGDLSLGPLTKFRSRNSEAVSPNHRCFQRDINTFRSRRSEARPRFTTKILSPLIIVIVVSLAACQKQKQEYPGIEGDIVNGTPLPPRQEGVSFFSNNVAKGQFPPIYFGFDSFEISPSEAEKLRQIAGFMKNARNNIILAGFTDERGTPEYNRGLGERRAQAARNYLLSAGVSPMRIQTVSFGQEMPADPGHDESAWAKNRRAETGIVR